jgi:hypothetical protein
MLLNIVPVVPNESVKLAEVLIVNHAFLTFEENHLKFVFGGMSIKQILAGFGLPQKARKDMACLKWTKIVPMNMPIVLLGKFIVELFQMVFLCFTNAITLHASGPIIFFWEHKLITCETRLRKVGLIHLVE